MMLLSPHNNGCATMAAQTTAAQQLLLQVLRYQHGQHYGAHHDFWPMQVGGSVGGWVGG
jgi:hypothetical protein